MDLAGYLPGMAICCSLDWRTLFLLRTCYAVTETSAPETGDTPILPWPSGRNIYLQDKTWPARYSLICFLCWKVMMLWLGAPSWNVLPHYFRSPWLLSFYGKQDLKINTPFLSGASEIPSRWAVWQFQSSGDNHVTLLYTCSGKVIHISIICLV